MTDDDLRRALTLNQPVVGALRSAVPDRMIPLLVDARTRVALRRGNLWERATAEMRFVLGDGAPTEAVEAAARRYIRHWYLRAEIRWHPRLETHQRVHGIEGLKDARSLKRGVIVNFMHHGHFEGGFASIARAGVPQAVLVSPTYFEPATEDSRRQVLILAIRAGNVAHNVRKGSEKIRGLLRAGNVVALATDVPGTTPVDFLGRRLWGSAGAARIASATGSPVVVMSSRRGTDGRPKVHLADPLDPADFGDPLLLLQEMVTQAESAVQAWPEAYDSPLNRWSQTPPPAAS